MLALERTESWRADARRVSGKHARRTWRPFRRMVYGGAINGTGTCRARTVARGGRRPGNTSPLDRPRPWRVRRAAWNTPTDPDRLALLDAGQWRPSVEADDPEVTSFHLPRWLSPASTLTAIVADHVRATRKRSLAVWTRTCAALPAEADHDLPDVGPLQARLEDVEHWPPTGIAFVVAATDVQSNRLENRHPRDAVE